MDLFRFRQKHTPQGVGHHRGRLRPWNAVWLVPPAPTSWVISYANEWEDHSNNWGITHSLVFWQCLGTVLALGVSFSLVLRSRFSWIWLVILDPSDFNQFMLCPWAMSFFQKLCSAPFPPVSCSSPEPLPVPQCCLYNLLEWQPENSWPLWKKCWMPARIPSVGGIPSRASGLFLSR